MDLQPLHLVREVGVIVLDHPISDHLEQAADFAADLRLALLGDGELAGAFNLRVGGLSEIGLQDDLQPLRREQLVREVLYHHAIECRHGDGTSGAVALALLRAAGAGVIAIAAGFAGADGHAALAGIATGEARKQRRAVDHARWVTPRVAGRQAGLDLLKILRGDDCGNGGCDPLLLRFLFPCLGAALIKNVLAHIGAAGEDTVHAGDLELLATEADALAIEPVDDGLDAQSRAVPAEGEVKDMPDQNGLRLQDDEALFCLGAAPFGLLNGIAKGRPGAVPEILTGILAHGAQRVFGVLLGLVLVEQPQELAHQIAGRIVLKGLGERDDLHAHLAQLADIEFRLELIAEEAGHGVDQDDVQRAVRGGRQIDEFLEFGAAVIGG